MSALATGCVGVVALLLDLLLGEPRRAHPLVGFGRWAQWLATRLYRDSRLAGSLAWSLAVLPFVLAAASVQWLLWWWSPWAALAWAAVALYAAVGLRSLGEHAQAVAGALARADLAAARAAVGRIVSRDTGALDATQVAAAATESVLENGSDAVFAALFWGLLLGAPGAVLYRLANTLDAMWGYRTPRYLRFGWAAARIDDVLNWVPARLTALTYALLGATAAALRCWRGQAAAWKSPNAGPVMAAGAGALRVQLGGAAPYHGQWQPRPALGEGAPADADSVRRALWLVRGGAALWCALLIAAALLGSY
ncbi:adenosylcobinamide-phosphate synthase CbiB [Stenotrophomonas sp. HITSZ_GD]|uniref:adenosylcobinamide-phosphate synthase CbiB n=1 Tax=Stenotrophomonas sp. HITSZ_GD TaxID=3037248 RepID=UPI00240E7C3E|nr:adenosylcobinamide-phosphate synthase CbiB [Stenotrophomonas sp. HITSZ_GD]MDG2525817.1 adenosylcobinamide-phosphate synthase CbiB [Stenotrophomonas sp. HITSZ_GD]